ncbi:calmodulin-like protein 5 [Aplysia californica]|uniref:Calmodulin-like protein 5 n=1 Tax=Aplysia californica TaxID=6500 RepID=A0ABM0KAK7_APLCA|nr:calmodulin-like protein 5 [Aplysia californica]
MAKMEAKLRKFFDEADADGKGTLSKFELCKVLQRGGCPDSTEEIASWFDEIDVNNDEEMTFEELWTALNKRDPDTVTEADLRSSFKEIDADGTGYITIDELKKEFEEQNKDCSEVEKILDIVDTNDDGKVNFEEFLAAWKENK